MERKKFFDILDKYRQGKASSEEKKVIDAWYEGIEEKRFILSETYKEDLAKYLWESIQANISEHKVSTTRKPRAAHRQLFWYSIAATLSIIAVITFLYLMYSRFSAETESSTHVEKKQRSRESWQQLKNAGEISQTHVLSDGSSVTLKPQSTIKFVPDFNAATREIYLEGEAFFEVAHNKERPFLVYANGIITKVLGTSFTVKAFKQDTDVVVSVNTGKVSVYNGQSTPDQKPEVILTPNHQIIYNRKNETISKGIVEAPQPVVQPEEVKRIRFEAARVKEIFEAIEKVYGIEIEFDKALLSCRLTTSISDGDLYNRLSIITRAIGAEYTLNEDKIVITGAGCD